MRQIAEICQYVGGDIVLENTCLLDGYRVSWKILCVFAEKIDTLEIHLSLTKHNQ